MGFSLLSLVALLTGSGFAVSIEGTPHEFGAWALVPPVLGVSLAVVTRRLITSLLIAVLVGGIIHHGWQGAVPMLVREQVVGRLSSPWHLQVLGFTCVLMGLVRVTTASGGAQALVDRVCAWVRSARSTRIATVLMGVVVFFDDYANCMLVGPTMRPLSDRYRISREKLAYLVDSTAAPVAGLMFVSTWVGYEAGLFQEVVSDLGMTWSGYTLLLAALPFRFYCVFALVTAFICALTGRDFGPMLRAERRALQGKVLSDSARAVAQPDEEPISSVSVEQRRARHAVLPIAALVVGALIGFVIESNGWGVVRERPSAVVSLSFWFDVLTGTEHHMTVLFQASLLGAFVALVMPMAERVMRPLLVFKAFFSGSRSAGYAVAVLLSAWALADICNGLGTGPFLIALVGDHLAPVLIPAASFALAAVVAFASGSSWGTMAVLIPVSVPLAHATGSELIVVLTAASVLDGSIFGDHCSPISDTTMMASIAAGSDHMDHVSTQLPYAVLGMILALVAGYLPAALGVPLPICYLVAVIAAFAVFRFWGRPIVVERS